MEDRDYFAAAALTGLVGACGYNSPEDVAGEAYALADAMIRERGTPVSDNCVAGNQPEIGCRPTLTAEEREAILAAVMEAESHQHSQRSATLRSLLERLR